MNLSKMDIEKETLQIKPIKMSRVKFKLLFCFKFTQPIRYFRAVILNDLIVYSLPFIYYVYVNGVNRDHWLIFPLLLILEAIMLLYSFVAGENAFSTSEFHRRIYGIGFFLRMAFVFLQFYTLLLLFFIALTLKLSGGFIRDRFLRTITKKNDYSGIIVCLILFILSCIMMISNFELIRAKNYMKFYNMYHKEKTNK